MHTVRMDGITVHFNMDLSGEVFLQNESDEIKMTFDTLKEIVLCLEDYSTVPINRTITREKETISIDSLVKIIHAIKGKE
jgi:hypothetical protein